MTKEELREAIAVEYGEGQWKDSFHGQFVTEKDRQLCYNYADRIIALFRKAGWVEKDEDQSLPDCEGPYEAVLSYRNGQEALIALGWVKVKAEK